MAFSVFAGGETNSSTLTDAYKIQTLIYGWRIWIEEVTAKHHNITAAAAWVLDFGETCTTIKFVRDSDAARSVEQAAWERKNKTA